MREDFTAPVKTQPMISTQSYPRPVSYYEGCNSSMSLPHTWDPTTLDSQRMMFSDPASQASDHGSQPAHYDDTQDWASKAPESSYLVQNWAQGLQGGQHADDASSLGQVAYAPTHQDAEPLSLHSHVESQRTPSSSFTFSTPGAGSDVTSPEELANSLPDEPPSFYAEVPPSSSASIISSSHPHRPTSSPRLAQSRRGRDLVVGRMRGKASPSPRPSARSVPYDLETGRNKRWSTGYYGPASGHLSPDRHGFQSAMNLYQAPLYVSTGVPQMANGSFPSSSPHSYMYDSSTTSMHHGGGLLMPPQLASHVPMQRSASYMPHSHNHLATSAPLLPNGAFSMLHSNGDHHVAHTSRYDSLSDPPDLFAPLCEEQLAPPEEDMNPTDLDMIPREQELRFDGDLYTPRWVRGHGNKREGWCGICKPGRWLVLKNSAYWYDKSFTHGVSASNGAPFRGPEATRRMDGNPDVWEGLCGGCNDWISLVSNKKKGTTWFRHAYKCHTQPRAKEGNKRRREKPALPAQLSIATMGRSRFDFHHPMTPVMSPQSVSDVQTPGSIMSMSSQLTSNPHPLPPTSAGSLQVPHYFAQEGDYTH